MGVIGVVAGVVVLVLARDVERELDWLALALIALFIGAAAVNVAWCVRQLRRPELLPETATLLTWRETAVRVVPWGVVPFAAVVFTAASSPTGATWVLGLGSLLLGLVTCGLAALTAQAERRRGTHVFRVGGRYALFVTR